MITYNGWEWDESNGHCSNCDRHASDCTCLDNLCSECGEYIEDCECECEGN